jgi:glycosyltransferase involved in cell wall biosynthesis
MRIGIDAHHINGKPQGSRTHLIELIRALSRIGEDEFLIYSFRPEETQKLLQSTNLLHRRVFPESARLRLPLVVPALELVDRLDLFHSQYLAPPLSFVPEVVTIHDVLFETHRDFFEGAFSARSVRLIRRSARRARIVLTVSEFSRQALVELYRLPEERVLVTGNAADPERFRPMTQAEKEASEVRRRYRLEGPFLLSVGRLEPRKNLARLIRAFGRVREHLDRGLVLALAGPEDFGSTEIVEEAQRLPAGSVRFLGPVTDEELPSFYNLAEALAYPSLAEGFGMPVLEAMACGTPVLSSPRGALTEVGGEAVLWVDPESEEEVACGLEKILTDDALRRKLAHQGPLRARAFSWEETARRTISAYRTAASL